MKKNFGDIFNNSLKQIGQDFWRHYALWTLLFTAWATILCAALFYSYKNEFFYIDTDCYTRALRIVDWLQNFTWAEKIFPFTNYPDGFVLHFTRINDVVWLLFSLPFMPFLPLKEAVFYGGFFFSPFFLYLTLVSVLWGVKPYLETKQNKELIFMAILLFALLFCCKLTTSFDFNRPDHHAVMCFVFTYNIAAVLRSYLKKNKAEMFFAGILGAVGMWASSAPEGLYVVFIILCVLSVDAIFFKQDNKAFHYSAGLFFGVTLAWLINPPFGGCFVLNNARLSFIHVMLCALIAGSFYIFESCNFKNKIKECCSLAFLALISMLIMFAVFGADTLLAPVGSETVMKYFMPRITEMNSIFGSFNFLILPAILGGALVFYIGFKQPFKYYFLMLYLLTVPLGVCIVRFYPYYIGVWVMLYAFGLIKVAGFINKSPKQKIIAFIYVIWPIFYFCSFDFLASKIDMPKMSGVVLTDVFRGPELVWQQNTDTVASPYHTNEEGIEDNHTMWFTTDENILKKLLRKHGITYIYLPDILISEYYVNPYDNTDKLYGKVLAQKDAYPWMQKIAERLYKVDYTKF